MGKSVQQVGEFAKFKGTDVSDTSTLHAGITLENIEG